MRKMSIPQYIHLHFFFTVFVAYYSVALSYGQTMNASFSIKAGVILNVGSRDPFDFDIVGPALEAAYEQSLREYRIQIEPLLFLYQGSCSTVNVSGKTYEAVNSSVDFIIGPACTHDLLQSLELQTFYKIPSVTGGGDLVDSTAKFPYVTRCAYNTYTQWIFVIHMFLHYRWTNIAVIWDNDDEEKEANAQSLKRRLSESNLILQEQSINSKTFGGLSEAETCLQKTSTQSRVVVLLMAGHLVRIFMVSAGRLHMTDGEYAFFALDVFRIEIIGKGNGWKQDDEFDKEARSAYKALLVLSLQDIEHHQMYKEVFGFISETAVLAHRKPVLNYFAAAFHDAVLLLALSVNETLMAGKTPFDKARTKEFSQSTWNRTYHAGATGAVYINPLGDRNDDHCLYELGADGTFHVVIQYFGFKVEGNPDYHYEVIVPIHWGSWTGIPPTEPPCGYHGESPLCDTSARTLGIALGAAVLIAAINTILGCCIHRETQRRNELAQLELLGTSSEVDLSKPIKKAFTQSSIHKHSQTSLESKPSESASGTVYATFRGIKSIIRICEPYNIAISRSLLAEIKLARTMSSDNILHLQGLCTGPDRVAVLYSYCAKGSLYEVLGNNDIYLDWFFRFSFILNFVKGLLALHSSAPLGTHGRLTSQCCFVDAYFVVKVADYGLPSFFARKVPFSMDSEFCATLLWTAPEHLVNLFGPGTQEGDVFSTGIIFQEVVTRLKPYGMFHLEPDVLVARISSKAKHFRPKVDANLCPAEISLLMKQCWAKNPLERPRLPQLMMVLKQTERESSERGNVLDALIRRMESYTYNLEQSVEEKTQQFLVEKEKSEQLLYQILPRSVVDQLKQGLQVAPEIFAEVTICYADIVSFTTLSSDSTPAETVDLLNNLYTCFDGCIRKFDAYKVETIGDCYVVASGVPDRNGNRHAAEICQLSLRLVLEIAAFKVPHRPGHKLQVRLGAHTGSCVSGVVGITMPRYCLFGETVTITAKMESSSQPMRIQISQSCERFLHSHRKFKTILRDDPIRINETLHINTYWLLEEIFDNI